MKPKALYYEILNYSTANLNFLAAHFELTRFHDPSEDLPNILHETEVLFAPLGFRVDQAKLNQCPNLKVIISNTTSVSHIDVDAANKRRIFVSALSDDQDYLEGITPTAEHTIGLILALTRKTIPASSDVLRGNWNRFQWGGEKMLSRMTLGIVGLGRIGCMVKRIAEAMKMKVLFYDPHRAGTLPSVKELVAHSDILSIHAVLSHETNNLVSRAVLEDLPKKAYVVNTARGEIVDINALIDLLESGHIAGAALDVMIGEYTPEFRENFKISRALQYAKTHDNLIMTPHIGGSTKDAWFETEQRVIFKAIDFMRKAETNELLGVHSS